MTSILYFERKSSEIRIRYLDEKDGAYSRAMKKAVFTSSPEETEKILIWLWKPYRVGKRRNVYDFQQVKLWIKLLPKVFPENLTLVEVQRMYFLEFQRENCPAPNTVFYRKFLIKLFIKLFCQIETRQDKEVWKPIGERFAYFKNKAAEVSDKGQIRWWKEAFNQETGVQKKFKRKLLSQDKFQYAKTHIRHGTLCVNSRGNPHVQVRKIVYETFKGCVPEGFQITHINQNTLDCRLENLTLEAGNTKRLHTKSQLSQTEKDAILEHWKSEKRNNPKFSVEKLSLRLNISANTIRRILKQH